ncbi:hypothetical protein Rleg10DRAFT_0149 [Rhizobium leguminosarum bv. trifolii WSM2012]|nr:hypothetical protein Rleg10DRAFT_0149 [Rhizobium leguminosarum bv. trifolii WSM2012]
MGAHLSLGEGRPGIHEYMLAAVSVSPIHKLDSLRRPTLDDGFRAYANRIGMIDADWTLKSER